MELEQFQYASLRDIQNPKWFLQARKPSGKRIRKSHKQPTINTWLQKMAITHHLRQTTKTWKIHTENQPASHQFEENEKNNGGNTKKF